MTNHPTDFRYINENSISTHLKCPSCSMPFVEPVIRQDETRLCRQCALLTDDEETLKPVTEAILLGLLGDLRVECRQCGKTNIRRRDFPSHCDTECPQRLVQCRAADINCPWKGLRDELDQHLKTCQFENLRACLLPLFAETKALKKEVEHLRKLSVPTRHHSKEEEYLAQNEMLVSSLEESRLTTLELNDRMNQFERTIDQLSRPSLPEIPSSFNDDLQILRVEFDQLKQWLENENSRNRQIENHLSQLRLEFDQQRVQIEQLISRLYEFENVKPNNIENHSIINEQIENLNSELTILKKQTFQQDIQIRLLARTRCILPVTNNHKNEPLEQLIEQFPSNDQIDLRESNINDSDLDIVYRKTVLEKQCRQLRLDKNQLTAKCGVSLSIILTNNTNLTALYLSKNKLNDTGVHIIAQTLAINNNRLTLLELNSNDLTDQSAEYLSEMLKINRTLERLFLESNRITDQGTRSLMEAVTYNNKTLLCLSLRANLLITDKSVEVFSTMFRSNLSLRALYINNCGLSDNGIQDIKQVASLDTYFELSA